MVPYLNLFLRETFGASDQTLGVLFSIASLVTGAGTLLSPWIARRLGSRIRALVLTQGASLAFLLVLGPHWWTLVPYLIIMTVGEALWQPRFLQYVAETAPEDKMGAYLGVARIDFERRLVFFTGRIVLRGCFSQKGHECHDYRRR